MAKILTKTNELAKQNICRPTRRDGFLRAKVYVWYAEVLKNRHNVVGRTFCDAINGGRYV